MHEHAAYQGLIMIFDSHAHYDDEQFDEDRDELLKSMHENGIERIVNIGADLASTRRSLALAEKYDFIWAAVGVHPSDVEGMTENDLEELRALSAHERCVAVGEIGLDYYWVKEPEKRAEQRHWFVRQMDLARETGLPIVIHSREAAKDTYDIMKAEDAGSIGGVVHCYSYSVEMARDFLNMGFYLGIGGVLTYKNSRVLKEVAAYAPLDRILLETDCPYLTPAPYRGKRNSSLYLPYVVSALSEIKGVSGAEIEAVTYANAMKMYRIKE